MGNIKIFFVWLFIIFSIYSIFKMGYMCGKGDMELRATQIGVAVFENKEFKWLPEASISPSNVRYFHKK